MPTENTAALLGKHMKPIRPRIALVSAVIAISIALDQATKTIAQTYLTPQTIHLLGDTVRLRLSENTGAFLSLGASLNPTLRFWIFTVAAAAMLVGVTAYALTADDIPRDGIIAMAFVAGGGISNLIDRTTRGGSVVDFLNFGIGSLRTGVLNVADIAIFFGALYVIWVGFRVGREGSQTELRPDP